MASGAEQQVADSNAVDKSVDKPTKIRGLKVKWASLVPRGANQHAHVAFFKNADGKPADATSAVQRFASAIAGLFRKADAMPTDTPEVEEMPRTTDEVLEQSALWDAWWKRRDAFDCSCREIMDSDIDDAAKVKMLAQSASEFAASVAGMIEGAPPDGIAKGLDDLVGDPVSVMHQINESIDRVERAANIPAREPAAEGAPMSTQVDKAAPAAGAANPAPAVDVEKMQKQIDDANAERVRLEKRLADMEESNKIAAIRKSVEPTAHPGVSTDEAVSIARKLHGTPEGEMFTKMLAGTTEMAKQSDLLREIGSGAAVEGSATAKVESLAKSLMAADPKRFPMIESARVAVYELHPDLRAGVQDEFQTTNRRAR